MMFKKICKRVNWAGFDLFCGVRAFALTCLGVLLAALCVPANAVTYAYRNDAFAYDAPAGSAATVAWHASGAAPACTGYPAGDDDWSDVAFPGGFSFTFGGASYSGVRVYSNGILAFGSDASGFHRDYTSQALPAPANGPQTGCPTGAPVNIMLPYWIDIVAGTANSTVGASVKYELLGSAPDRRLVISWVNVKLYNTSTRYNFQVALYESSPGTNGNFRFQYTSGSSDGANATVGVQLSQTDFTQYSFNQKFIDTVNGTSILWYPANQLATKSAEYRFDEAFWLGDAGEVKDTSGNSRDASRIGLVANVPNGKLCRGGMFTANTSDAITDVVVTPVVPGNSGSIDFWFNSNVAWNSGVAMLLDATVAANRPFFLMKAATGALTFRVTDSAGASITVVTPAKTFALNTWHHVGVTWNVRVGTNQTALQIFVDGVLQNGAPTRGTTNGIMPPMSSLAVGDNRTTGITPTGGSPNGANGRIDEVYIYPIEISAPQATADMNLTRPTCSALDHFQIVHDGAVSSCGAPAHITIRAHDAAHAPFSLAGSTMTLSTSPAHGTWSNVSGGAINPLTAIGAGTGTATYTFANESSVTFGLSDNLSESLNINVALGGVTEHTGTAGTCSPDDYSTGTICDAGRVFVCAKPVGFNCVQSGTDPLTGHLFTKLAGTPFAFDVVALKDSNNDGVADAVETAYASDADKNVTVELVDGAGTGACAGRVAVSPAVSQTLAFTKASQPAELGRKSTANMTVSKAYANLLCRVTDASASPSIVGCSSDGFAVRPTSFAVASSANADNAGASVSAAPVVKAGANFSLSATSGVVGYNLAPKVDASKVAAHAGALQSGVVAGSFDAANALTGAATGAAFTYSEVGYFNFAAGGVYDDTFTAVDATAGDCVPGLVDGGGKYACSFGNAATTNFFGRFVPDHFAVVSSNLTQACAAGSFTYMGQPFGMTATIEAKNLSGGKTGNYRGSFAKGVVTAQAENANNGTSLGSRLGFTAPWSDGTSALAVTQFARPVSTIADATWGPYESLAIGASVIDSDGVQLINRNMDQSNVTCTADTAGTSDGSCIAATLAGNLNMRLGRLRLQNAYGSELLALPVPLEAQYWAGSYYVSNTADSCTVIPMASVMMGNYLKQLNACETQLTPTGNVALVAGKLPGAGLVLTKPGVGNMGSVDLAINVSATAAGNTCVSASQTAASAANMPWFGPNVGARATFGIYKSPLIYRRENY